MENNFFDCILITLENGRFYTELASPIGLMHGALRDPHGLGNRGKNYFIPL